MRIRPFPSGNHAADFKRPNWSAVESAETTKERHRIFVVFLSSCSHNADRAANLNDIGHPRIGARGLERRKRRDQRQK